MSIKYLRSEVNQGPPRSLEFGSGSERKERNRFLIKYPQEKKYQINSRFSKKIEKHPDCSTVGRFAIYIYIFLEIFSVYEINILKLDTNN